MGVQSPKLVSEKNHSVIFTANTFFLGQNKLKFYFSIRGVLNVRGGWVGSDVWDKVLKKRVFFTPSLTWVGGLSPYP